MYSYQFSSHSIKIDQFSSHNVKIYHIRWLINSHWFKMHHMELEGERGRSAGRKRASMPSHLTLSRKDRSSSRTTSTTEMAKETCRR